MADTRRITNIGAAVEYVPTQKRQLSNIGVMVEASYRTNYNPATADTEIRQGSATTNYGTATTISAGYGSTAATEYDALVRIDTTDLAAKPHTFRLQLALNATAVAKTDLIIRRVRRSDWVEAEATWNAYKTANNWTTAGAKSTADDIYSDSVAVTISAGTGWKYIDITPLWTPGLTQLDLIICPATYEASKLFTFKSANDETASNRPYLIGDYGELDETRRVTTTALMVEYVNPTAAPEIHLYTGGTTGEADGTVLSSDGSDSSAIRTRDEDIGVAIPLHARCTTDTHTNGTVTVTAQDGFSVSLDGATWLTSVDIGVVEDTNVALWIRQDRKLAYGLDAVLTVTFVGIVESVPPVLTGDLTLTPADHSLVCDWTDGTDASGIWYYLVDVADNADFTDYERLTPNPTASNCTITGIDDEEQDTYVRVYAVDMNSNVSAPITAHAKPADTTAPTLGGSLTVTAGDGKVTVGGTTASDARGIAGYVIEHGATTAYGTEVTVTTTATTLPATDISGANGAVRYVRVSSFDAAGNRTAVGSRQTGSATPAALGAPILVAVGKGSNQLASSPDGTSWTARTNHGLSNGGRCAVWSPELGMFVAGGAGSTANGAYATSANGTTWTARNMSAAIAYYIDGVAWSPSLGMFAAVGEGTSNTIASSTNGTDWTGRNAAILATGNGVTWCKELGLFVAVGAGSNDAIPVATSTDGVNWTGRGTGFVRYANAKCVAWSPSLNLFVVGCQPGGSGGSVYTSPDGINWTTRGRPFASSCLGVAWSPSLNLFVAVGSDATNTIMTSPDGVNWTGRGKTVFTNNGSGVAWSAVLGLFIATGNGTNCIATSPDGVNWTPRAVGMFSTYGLGVCA